MKFVVIIYHGSAPLPGSDAWNALSDAARQQVFNDYAALNQDPRIGVKLPPLSPTTATTVQVREGRVEAKPGTYLEQGIGGAFEFEAEDMEAAIALAARIPQARLGGAIEIRPVEQYY